jgi:hypothetical protein
VEGASNSAGVPNFEVDTANKDADQCPLGRSFVNALSAPDKPAEHTV